MTICLYCYWEVLSYFPMYNMASVVPSYPKSDDLNKTEFTLPEDALISIWSIPALLFLKRFLKITLYWILMMNFEFPLWWYLTTRGHSFIKFHSYCIKLPYQYCKLRKYSTLQILAGLHNCYLVLKVNFLYELFFPKYETITSLILELGFI